MQHNGRFAISYRFITLYNFKGILSKKENLRASLDILDSLSRKYLLESFNFISNFLNRNGLVTPLGTGPIDRTNRDG